MNGKDGVLVLSSSFTAGFRLFFLSHALLAVPRGNAVRGSNPILAEALARAWAAYADHPLKLKIVSPYESSAG